MAETVAYGGDGQMEVEVRLFAQVREVVGQERIRLQLPNGARIGILRAELVKRYPALAARQMLLLFALNGQYADDNTPIPPGAEIACFPPVGGG
ncbi:MAG: MoaD/ThiS family protein [Thermoguttaceae bacterium]|nr:MoaD/ThiS family protein [Thermoguttaceae bacterium]MDW8038291.1 MoaD/ThiS family protein [Thermoguttaceae bacterium]